LISGDLKKLIEAETKIAPALQKVLIKGIPKDEVILKSLGVTSSTKIMVIGTTLDDVMSVSKAPDKEALAAEESNASKDSSNWCSMTQHKKIIDKVSLSVLSMEYCFIKSNCIKSLQLMRMFVVGST